MPAPRTALHRLGRTIAAALCLTGAQAAQAQVVAAASSLQFAIGEIAAHFSAETGAEVTVALGSSGNLARQIRQGAPYEIFLSADESFADALARDGFADGPARVYAQGRLALFVPHGSPLAPDPTLQDLRAALADGRLHRFAIANPDHAPYGDRARAVLTGAGLWAAVEPHLVIGEAVSQAAQFAASGNAEGGLIAASLAAAPELAARGDFALVPAGRHAPLLQRMVLLRGAGPQARDFFAYLEGDAARAIFAAHGFARPDAPR